MEKPLLNPSSPFRLPFVVLYLLLSAILFQSCGTSGRTFDSENRSRSYRVDVLLQDAHRDWRGTPYLLGGAGRRGIDCSAFTREVYKEYFGVSLPRHTRDQIREGRSVRRSGIRPGDMIFFETSRGVLHVGIAMQNGRFLHASTSQGVTISDLSNRYWSKRFLRACRVI